MTKIRLTLIVAICLLVITSEAREIGGINYSFNLEYRTAVVTRRDYNTYSGNVSIPTKVTFQKRSFDVVRIDDGAFANSSVISVKVPNTVKEIGAYAFTNCLELTKVSLSNGLEVIGDEAFSHCPQLREIQIPVTVKRLMYNAFDESSVRKNPENWDNKALYIDNCLIFVDGSISGHFDVRPGTRLIADAAFCRVLKLQSLVIPSSVVSIGAMSSIAYGLPAEATANSRNMRFWSYYRYPFNATPDSIVIESTTPPYIDEVLATFPVNARIYVPEKSLDLYKENGWSALNLNPIDVNKLRKYLNEQIEISRKDYNDRLKKNPYYDGSAIRVEPISETQTDISKMRLAYTRTISAMDQVFTKLQRGGMVKKMQKNDPDKYIEIYRGLHPKVSTLIDETLVEYRCQPELTRKICLRIIAKRPLDPPVCRASQFKAYGHLFESEEHFNKRYNNAATNDEFMDEIKARQKAAATLEELEKLLAKEGKTLNLSGTINKKDNSVAGKVNKYERELRESYYYDQGVQLLFKYCPLLVAEFKVNKLYFLSRAEFYEAYISKDYNKFLKKRKTT